MKQKPASIRDVAAKAGVSIMTVSRALNNKAVVSEKIKQKVFSSCDELGYQINPGIQDLVRKWRNGHTRNIAFVLVGVEFADPAYARNMDGIAKAINEFDYNLAMAYLNGEEQSVQHLPPVLRDGRIDGFIVSGDLTEDMMNIFKKLAKPYVVLGNYSEKVSGDSVRLEINYKSTMFRIVSELKKVGRKRIAYFTETPGNFFESELVELFIKSMKENQLDLNEQIIYSGTGAFSGAFERLKPIFRQQEMPFDAIVCMDFRCAQEIANLILVRSGFDKKAEIMLACMRPFSYYKLAVPTIYCEAEMNVAYTGVKCLIEMITKGDLSPHKLELSPQISVEI